MAKKKLRPMSSTVWINTSTLPNAIAPVSVLEYHGDADTVLNYCGGMVGEWGEKPFPNPAVDASVNYWLAQDGMPPNLTPLCTNGSPTPGLYSLDFKGPNGIEVEFLRQSGMAHGYSATTTAGIWAFFAGHGKSTN